MEIGNRILVRRQIEAVTGQLREPKTRAGTRFVEMPAFVMIQLIEWKLRCPKDTFDLCFPDSKGNPMDDRNFGNRVFYPALRRASNDCHRRRPGGDLPAAGTRQCWHNPLDLHALL